MNPIEDILSQLNRPCKVIGYSDAPQVYRVQLQPLHRPTGNGGRGQLTRARHLELMTQDIALGLGLDEVEIAVEDGKLWLLVPKSERDLVLFESVKAWGTLPWVLGRDVHGDDLFLDLAHPASPHVLIAGTTGSGKTVALKSAISWLLLKRRQPMVLIDTKHELSVFADHPSVAVVHDARHALKHLEMLRKDAELRFKRGIHPDDPNIGRLLIVIDEFADLVFQYPEVENVMVRMAQKVRAAGYHLVMATQRPTVDVVTGLIKANMPVRVAYQCVSKTDSKVILDQNGAEKLLGMGDGLLMMSGKLARFQGAYVEDRWIENWIRGLR
jgi:S-DNA-T family DNA segregation ATPase FtsK/SpoIIIE